MPFAAIYICWGLFIGVWALGAFYNARYAPRTVSRDTWPGSRPWLGWMIVAGVLLVQALVSGGVFLLRIRREEQFMLQTFGAEYVRYQHQVAPLVPFVHI
jgi:protein-S-isoprenylcysteine O-methyltransferase Ste14